MDILLSKRNSFLLTSCSCSILQSTVWWFAILVAILVVPSSLSDVVKRQARTLGVHHGKASSADFSRVKDKKTIVFLPYQYHVQSSSRFIKLTRFWLSVGAAVLSCLRLLWWLA
jgi:hypothetical protein